MNDATLHNVGLITKYHGPTNTRGSRITCRRSDHQPGDMIVTISYPCDCSQGEAHTRAALEYCAKMNAKNPGYGWDRRADRLVGVSIPDGYAFGFLSA